MRASLSPSKRMPTDTNMDTQSQIDGLKSLGFNIEPVEVSDYDRWMNNAIEMKNLKRYEEALSCCRYLLESFPDNSPEIYKRMVSIEEEHAQWAREQNDWIQNDNSLWAAYRCLRLAGYGCREFSKIKKRLMDNLSMSDRIEKSAN